MKFEERKQAICAKCESAAVCGFYLSPSRTMCEYLQHVQEGWEMGREDTLTAVEDYVDRGNSTFTEEFMEGLKQHLEGEDYEED